MDNKMKSGQKVIQNRDAVDRYELLKDLGRSEFVESHVVRTGEVDESDVVRAKTLYGKAITATNPEVWATFFEHVFIAPELGRRIAEAYMSQYSSSERSESRSSRQARTINVHEVEFLLWLHELGRLVTPSAYFRNDLIDDRLLIEFGLPDRLRGELPSIRNTMEVGLQLRLSSAQIRGEERLNNRQEKMAMDFFSQLTTSQRVISIADNLGKRDDEGKLFNLQGFLRYLRSQEQRYDQTTSWHSVDWHVRPEKYKTEEGEEVEITRRLAGSILQAFIIEKAVEWLQKEGVEVENVLRELENYGPKFVLLVRHGDPDNPKNIVYNLDEVMKEEDVIHISDQGRDQLKALGMVIKKRKFRLAKIAYSNQIRAIESAKELNKVLNVFNEQVDPRLKDLYAPGAYLEGLTMDQWKKQKGNAYDKVRWGKYNHEEPDSVIERIDEVFWESVKRLKVGQTAILLSHGDPIALWINHQVTGKMPQADALRDQIYPNQGQAIVCIIDPEGNFFTYYILTDLSLIKGESY